MYRFFTVPQAAFARLSRDFMGGGLNLGQEAVRRWWVRVNYGIAAVVLLLGVVAVTLSIWVALKGPASAFQGAARGAQMAAQGGWALSCDLSLVGMEDCKAVQSVYWAGAETLALKASFSARERAGRRVYRLQLRAPLGSFLPAGFSLGLEGQEPLIVPYQACDVEGCFVNLDLAPDIEAAIRREGAMVVEYMTAEQKIATVKIPLAGINDVLVRVGE